MSSKNINIILLMMLLTICSLFVTQAYWFKKSFTLEERQFDEKMNIALRNVTNQLLLFDNDSIKKIVPVVKISSNEYFVRVDCYFSLSKLDSLIRVEFSKRKITASFDYIIIESDSNYIKLGNTLASFKDTTIVSCKVRRDDKENLDFKIRINNKTTYLLNSMGIWMYSSISLLFLLGFFTFIIVTIIKGKKLSALKKDFVNNMTHELKTPIANISIASEAIRNNNVTMDEQKLKKYADIIYKENYRLHNLVDTVLQISSMEKKEESFLMKEIDLHKIISSAAQSFEPLILQKNGALSLDLTAQNYFIKGDKIHLTNIFYNLIDNAIKYSENGPKISITTSVVKNGIDIQVSDKGLGIKKENQERVFEKFYREESGNLHNTKGFGLGLSYVKLIVEKHKGSISVESSKSNGSDFNLFLPI